MITPDELQADTRLLRAQREGVASQVRESEAALRFQQRQTDRSDPPGRSRRSRRPRRRSTPPPADLESARLTFDADAEPVASSGVASPQELDQARTAFDAAQAQARCAEASRSRRSARRWRSRGRTPSRSRCAAARSQTNEHMQAAAAAQQHEGRRPARATPRSTRRSTASSTCAPRASARSSTPGQPIVTLINPDDLWVRADVEETYIDRVRIGDTLTVRLPSGVERAGHGVLPRRRRRRSRRSATSAAPSATSRRSRSACASTTRIAGSRSA